MSYQLSSLQQTTIDKLKELIYTILNKFEQMISTYDKSKTLSIQIQSAMISTVLCSQTSCDFFKQVQYTEIQKETIESFINTTKDLQKVYKAEPNKDIFVIFINRLSVLISEVITFNTSIEKLKKCDLLTELENVKSNSVQLNSVLIQKDFKGNNSVGMAQIYLLKYNILDCLLNNFYQLQVKENVSTQFRQMFLNALSLYYDQEINTVSMKEIKDQVPYPVFKKFNDFVYYCDDQHADKIEIAGVVLPAILTLKSDVKSDKPNYTIDYLLQTQPLPFIKDPLKSIDDLKNVTECLQHVTFDIENAQNNLKILQKDTNKLITNQTLAQNYIQNLKLELNRRVEEEKQAIVVAISFEDYFMEITKTVVIKESNGDVKYYTFKITQTMNDGEMFSVDNKFFILKVVHQKLRRENDDVVCYLNDDEIKELYKNVINTLSVLAINFMSKEIKSEEKRVTGAGFKKKSGGFGDFVIRKINNKIPENLPSALKEQILKERSLLKNAENLLLDFASKIQSTQILIETEKNKIIAKQREIDNLNQKKKKLEEIIIKEKLKIKRKREEYDQKIWEEGGQIEIIIKEAQEERRIALYKLSQNKMVSYKENKTNTNGLYHFEFDNQEFCVKECIDDKDNIFDINTVGRGKNKMKQMNVKLIGINKKDKNHDFSNTHEVLDILSKEQNVIVFDVDIPKDYNKRVFPVVVCHLSQIKINTNLPLVFPVEVPRCDSVCEYIYVNGYDKTNKDQNGIIVLHVHQKGVVEYNTLKVSSEEIVFECSGNYTRETEKSEISDMYLDDKIEKVNCSLKDQSLIKTNQNKIIEIKKAQTNIVKKEPKRWETVEQKDKTKNVVLKKTTPLRKDMTSLKKEDKIKKGKYKDITRETFKTKDYETIRFDDLYFEQWERLKEIEKNNNFELIACQGVLFKISLGNFFLFEKDGVEYQVSINNNIRKFLAHEKDGVESYIYNVEKIEEEKSFVTDMSFTVTKILIEQIKKSPYQKVFGVVVGSVQWKNLKSEQKTMHIIIPIDKDWVNKNFTFKISKKLVYKSKKASAENLDSQIVFRKQSQKIYKEFEDRIIQLEDTNKMLTQKINENENLINQQENDITAKQCVIKALQTTINNLQQTTPKVEQKRDTMESEFNIQNYKKDKKMVEIINTEIPQLLFMKGGNFSINIHEEILEFNVPQYSEEPIVYKIEGKGRVDGKVNQSLMITASMEKDESCVIIGKDVFKSIAVSKEFIGKYITIPVTVLDYQDNIQFVVQDEITLKIANYGWFEKESKIRGDLFITIKTV
ncbi:hypothetical protein EIN_324210 [Entamoeba invadens IP1]|uniref:Uncharacterized protein n=1 Tax=Entamoeba invadens IP1 TaxID=370355 RepID=L7FNR7_ENTIV|nr:hypothetical protein EIN_324210 [Entamoeba invadens IP1]ELP92503.1 hypothetical protein EIN_324210 [Entamoeba invadens IP1]|eukprot:XP_004259274.1 hypothetical protein EIN_324210 [Entamoeba invadens IP1]